MSDAAKGLLRDPNTSAVALIEAAHRLLGDFLSWEPESIWLELRHLGVEVPAPCRHRLMAALTLRLMPAFYWDGIVFEKTAVAMDGHSPNPDTLEEATPAQLAWAVEEAAWILRRSKDTAHEFQYEPRAYTAVALARAGYVLAPDELRFAQAQLDRQAPNAELREEVAARWAKVSKEHLTQLTLGEDRVDVQIARLASVALHVRDRRTAAERELGVLG